MHISEEGYCINWRSCMPSKNNRASFVTVSSIRGRQNEWIEYHDCFVSGDRVYADVVLGKNCYIIDAITGTLYDSSGVCCNSESDLVIDLSLIERDKTYIKELVCLQH